MRLIFEVNTEGPKICYNHLTNPEGTLPASSTDSEGEAQVGRNDAQ